MSEAPLRQSYPAIFYGAGQWAADNMPYLKGYGLVPLCFADKDPKKHNTDFGDGTGIQSLENALKQYPNADVFITVDNSKWESVRDELLATGLVSAEQLLNFKLCKKYVSCRFLENQFATVTNAATGEQTLRACCFPWKSPKPMVNINPDNYEATVGAYLAVRDRARAGWNDATAQSEYCTNCPLLREGYWFTHDFFTDFTAGGQGVCQFKCTYCGGRANPSLPDYEKLFEVLRKKKLIDDNLKIHMAAGEIAVHPNSDEILAAMQHYPCEILTNAGKFSEMILEILKDRRSNICVSMDAGTRETFSRIKGVDQYERVCDNLRRYAAGGGRITLKYILLPGVNDNLDDAQGFLKLCKELGVQELILSIDSKRDVPALPDQAVSVGRYLYQNGSKIVPKVFLITEYFCDTDVEKIMSQVKSSG